MPHLSFDIQNVLLNYTESISRYWRLPLCINFASFFNVLLFFLHSVSRISLSMQPILIASFKDQEILETVNEQSLPVLYGSLLWLSVLGEEQIMTCS